jgi:Ca2+-binding EF-hand superfamily protein
MSVREVRVQDPSDGQRSSQPALLVTTKEALSGFVRDVKSRFAPSNSGSDAHTQKQVLRRISNVAADTSEMSRRERQIHATLNQSAQTQASLLTSIDHSLKNMLSHMATEKQRSAARSAENKIKQLRSDAAKDHARYSKSHGNRSMGGKDSKLKRIAEASKKFGKKAVEKAGDAFDVASFLKYGAAIASTGFDAFKGFQNASGSGESGVLGALSGFMAGSGKGGLGMAVKKSLDLATIGHMISGPTGALFGAVSGGLAGFIGSNEFLGFVKDSLKNLYGTYLRKVGDVIASGIEKLLDPVEEMSFKLLDGIRTNVIDPVMTAVKDWFRNVIGGAFEKLSNILRKLGFNDTADKVAGIVQQGKKEKVVDEIQHVLDRYEREDDRKRELEEIKRKRDARAEKGSFVRAFHEISDDAQTRVKRNDGGGSIMDGLLAPLTSAYGGIQRLSGGLGELASSVLGGNPVEQITSFMKKLGIDSLDKLSPQMQEGIKGGFQKVGLKYEDLIRALDENTKANEEEIKARRADKDPSSKYRVGQIPGYAVQDVAEAANNMIPKSGTTDLPKISPERLASMVQVESSGNPNVKPGDGGKSHGVMQMKAEALADVNKHFGMNLKMTDLADPMTAMMAGALYYRLRAKGKTTEMGAVAAYNGSGEQSYEYAMKVLDVEKSRSPMPMNMPDVPPQVAPVPAAVPPKGVQLTTKNAENRTLNYNRELAVNRAPGSQLPMVLAPQTTVNNKNDTVLMNIPIRSNEPTLMDSYFLGQRFGGSR